MRPFIVITYLPHYSLFDLFINILLSFNRLLLCSSKFHLLHHHLALLGILPESIYIIRLSLLLPLLFILLQSQFSCLLLSLCTLYGFNHLAHGCHGLRLHFALLLRLLLHRSLLLEFGLSCSLERLSHLTDGVNLDLLWASCLARNNGDLDVFEVFLLLPQS
jgi:hypothetical protein